MRTMCSESVHGDEGPGQHSIDTAPEKTAREYKVKRHGAIRRFQLDLFASPFCFCAEVEGFVNDITSMDERHKELAGIVEGLEVWKECEELRQGV